MIDRGSLGKNIYVVNTQWIGPEYAVQKHTVEAGKIYIMEDSGGQVMCTILLESGSVVHYGAEGVFSNKRDAMKFRNQLVRNDQKADFSL